MLRLQGNEKDGWQILVGVTGCVPVAKIVRDAGGYWGVQFEGKFLWGATYMREILAKVEYANGHYPPRNPFEYTADDDIPF